MKKFLAIMICLMFSGAIACAQPAPPPRDGGGGGDGDHGGPPGRRNDDHGDRPRPGGMGGGPGMGGPGMAMDGPGRGGPDGMGPGGGPMRQFEMLRGYLDVVDRYAKVSSDPTTAGIAAVVAAAEVLKPRGPDAMIEFFNKLLPEVRNESVARAIRSQLAEQYKASGQADKSLEQLRMLITGSSGEPEKH